VLPPFKEQELIDSGIPKKEGLESKRLTRKMATDLWQQRSAGAKLDIATEFLWRLNRSPNQLLLLDEVQAELAWDRMKPEGLQDPFCFEDRQRAKKVRISMII
jgi:hypothetical protein